MHALLSLDRDKCPADAADAAAADGGRGRAAAEVRDAGDRTGLKEHTGRDCSAGPRVVSLEASSCLKPGSMTEAAA